MLIQWKCARMFFLECTQGFGVNWKKEGVHMHVQGGEMLNAIRLGVNGTHKCTPVFVNGCILA